MTPLSRAWTWLRDALRRSRVEQRMDDELRFHIDSYAADLERGVAVDMEAELLVPVRRSTRERRTASRSHIHARDSGVMPSPAGFRECRR